MALGLGLAASAAVCAAASAATAPAVNPADFPAGKGREVFLRACGGCHPQTIVKSHLHDDDGWDDTIGKMVQRGAKANDAEQDEIREYLARNFAPGAKPAPSAVAKAPRGNGKPAPVARPVRKPGA
jgi:hypothetical protein